MNFWVAWRVPQTKKPSTGNTQSSVELWQNICEIHIIHTWAKWACHSAGSWPVHGSFQQPQAVFSWILLACGCLISVPSVMGVWRKAVLKLPIVTFQHLEHVISKRTLSVTGVGGSSKDTVVFSMKPLTHCLHLTLGALFLPKCHLVCCQCPLANSFQLPFHHTHRTLHWLHVRLRFRQWFLVQSMHLQRTPIMDRCVQELLHQQC